MYFIELNLLLVIAITEEVTGQVLDELNSVEQQQCEANPHVSA